MQCRTRDRYHFAHRRMFVYITTELLVGTGTTISHIVGSCAIYQWTVSIGMARTMLMQWLSIRSCVDSI